VSIVKSIPGFDASLYWTYCLNCKEPMFGIQEECPQTLHCICAVCGAVNVFSGSPQPIQLRSVENPKPHLSNCIQSTVGESV
jgi:hypothetical protein